MLAALLLAMGAGCTAAPAEVDDSDNDSTADDDDDTGSDDDSAGDGDDDDDEAPPRQDAGKKDSAAAPSGPARDSGVAPEDKTGKGDASAPPPATGALTWCSVKPIVTKYCTVCHEEGGAAPMSLLTAADFQAAAPTSSGKKVHEVSKTRINDTAKPMPPKQKLTADELKTLNEWLTAGAPAGSDTECAGTTTPPPDASGRVDGWNEEECDEIYEVRSHGPGGKDSPYAVPPGGEIHPQIRIDAPWGTEKVQAIGFKPITDNKNVLHHWILNGFGRSFLAGWAPGDEGRPPFPKDVGMDMPSGAGAFTLDMHYYNSKPGAKTEMDRSGVAICVLKQANFRKNLAAVTGSLASIGSGGILAPRMSTNKAATSTCAVNASQPVHILTAAPHAHKYAVHMKFTVKKKSGQEIVMHDQPFNFGEQGTYALEGGEVLVETGDVITTSCVYTNNTSKDIRFGESTESEMCFNFALYWPKGAFSCGGGGLGGLGGLSFQ
jgi:hypothetical protein